MIESHISAQRYYFPAMPRKIDEEKPLFTIGAVADILDIKPRLLRQYEERGLIAPSRTEGNRRLYSLKDIDILAYIQYLTTVKRVNMAGVLEIQDLLKKLDSKTRTAFMSEIEEEINQLPQEKRKAFTGEDEELSDAFMLETVEFSTKGKKKKAKQRPSH